MENISKIALGVISLAIILGVGMMILGSIGDNVLSTNSSIDASKVFIGDYASSQTLNGTPSSLIATSKNNSWLEFDGVNDYVRSSLTDLNYSKGFSYSAWVNVEKLKGNHENKIVYSKNTTGTWAYFTLAARNYSDTQARFYFRGQFNESGCDEAGTAIFNREDFFQQWYHLIGIYNTTDSVLYVNGIINGTETFTAGCIPLMDSEIGGTMSYLDVNSEVSPLKGGIDEVRIYNRTLTGTESLQIYNSGRNANSSLPSTGLVLWYSFDEASGTTVYDKSGEGNHGE